MTFSSLRLLGLALILSPLLASSTGCCKWCERHCSPPAPTYAAAPAPVYIQQQPVYAQPAQQCVPVQQAACPPGTVPVNTPGFARYYSPQVQYYPPTAINSCPCP